MDLPVVFDLDAIGRGEAPLRWDEGYGARIGIVPRFGTDADVRWFDVDPCYVFHPLNAFADGDTVICDVGRHEHMWRSSMDDFPPSYLHRWTFDLATGAVTEAPLDDVPHAFPGSTSGSSASPTATGGQPAPRGDGEDRFTEPGVVVKYDLRDGSSARFDVGPHGHPGEFVFVPASDAAGEDEGWAMGLVYDDGTGRSDLVILDATAPDAEPVARVHVPARIPYGFHGSWVDDAALPT